MRFFKFAFHNDYQLKQLEFFESKIMSAIKTKIIKTNVNGINTFSTTDATKPPILLLHGAGIWVKNVDFLSQYYQVHFIDILGFGLSKPKKNCLNPLGKRPQDIQNWWVESIEDWLKHTGLEKKKFSLVGHSMGGFIARMSYALKNPKNIEKLVLLSPIGLNGFNVDKIEKNYENRKLIIKNFLIQKFWNFTPQRILPLIGLERLKLMIAKTRRGVVSAFPFKDDTVLDYIVHINRSGLITGPVAFTRLLNPSEGWLLPLSPKLKYFNPDFEVSICYGDRDWMDATYAEAFDLCNKIICQENMGIKIKSCESLEEMNHLKRSIGGISIS
ncbi:Alpha/beta hydrolase domain-containing protein 4 [Clydaea vesicula]|uniref:Alpha/beta hydrolase domain-containing protein 4 n=1 Tax=Clydaea vesicula TaxID=447962 RepID=A0AAD5U685_9FUNG|nr:Alpha/beta hydrolase domain-containing protein 4 [Clydaea vesicula]